MISFLGNPAGRKSRFGHTNLIFSLTGPSDPNCSKIKKKILQKSQICFCKTLNIIQSWSNKKETICLQIFQRWRWSEELFAFSFVVPSFQGYLSLISILNYCFYKPVLRNLHFFTKSIIFFYCDRLTLYFFIVSHVKLKIKLLWPYCERYPN